MHTKTSRAQLDRLLDRDNESVTLDTLTRAAQAVGRNLNGAGLAWEARLVSCTAARRADLRGPLAERRVS
jgi:hypothetical protein